MTDSLSSTDAIADLREQIAELERGIIMANDAAFGIAGIVCRILVEAQAIGREQLADAIEVRAGCEDSADFNPALQVFARALRMNLPGGRFGVIDGGRSGDLDPA